MAADANRVAEQYRGLADRYDRRVSGWLKRYRRRAVEHLHPQSADGVLDVACGTGINFPLLQERLGPTGKIVGVELSPEMLSIAHKRVLDHGWQNVELIEGNVEDVPLAGPLDAALFSLTHDVLQSASALHNIVQHLKPGARVASFGAKGAPRWRVPVNIVVRATARRYVTTLEGFDQPWRHLRRVAPNLEVEEVALGGAYIAWGTAVRVDEAGTTGPPEAA